MKRAGRLLLLIVVLVALAAPWLAPNPPDQVFDDLLYAPPTRLHLLAPAGVEAGDNRGERDLRRRRIPLDR